MKKQKNKAFKYFVFSDSEGGCEQETGSFVSAYDTLDEAVEAIREKLVYIYGGDLDAVSKEIDGIRKFVPDNKSVTVYKNTLENGGDDDDWFREDFGIMYTNIGDEYTSYGI